MNIYDALCAPVFSDEWNLSEILVIQRCFDLGFLKRITRGSRKNLIEITSPGASQKPETVESGLIEAHVRVDAYLTYRELHPMQEKGAYAIFFAYDGLNSINDRQIANSASQIGKWLGLVVSVWNDLGGAWPDLWDVFEKLGNAGQPFLSFTRVCQNARGTVSPHDTTTDVLLKMLKAIATPLDKGRSAFKPHSPEFCVLEFIGIHTNSILKLPATFERWAKTKRLWFDWAATKEKVSTPNISVPDKAPWEAMMESFAEDA